MAAAEKEIQEEIETQEPTLRDQLISARDEAIARQEAPDEQKPEAKPDRSRDQSGRFAPKTVEPSVESAPEVNKATAEPSPPKEAAPAAQQPVDAPQSWAAPEKAHWAKVPPEVRAIINRREQEYHKTLTVHDEVRKVGREFMAEATKYASVVQSRGGNPVGLFSEFMQILGNMGNMNPSQRGLYIQEIGRRLGADFSQLPQRQAQASQPGATPQNQQVIHPAVAQMVQEWNQYRQNMQQQETRQRQEKEQYERAEMTRLTAEIESFRSDPKHAHFEQVSGLMTSLLNDGHAEGLEEAYNLAIKAHPQVSAQLELERQQQQKLEAEKRQKAQLARQKAGSVKGGTGNMTPNTQAGSVRAELEKAFAEARGRV